jgi:two-component system cell cycle sensor histidine kinase/response regulator CckA
MPKPLRALFVEDNENDALLVARALTRGGFEVSWERVETREGMAAALDRGPWDLIISDFRMPQFSASEAVALYRERGQDTPFILVSGTVGEKQAVDALKAGAHDFFLKHELTLLPPAVERELREAENRRAWREAEKEREESRAATLAEKAFSEALLDSLPGIFFLVDEEGKFLRWNRSLVRTLGYSADELAQLPAVDLFAPEDRGLVEAGLRRVLDTGAATLEVDLLSKEGAQTPYFLTGSRFVVAGKACCIATGIDVSARKLLEAELAQAQRIEAIGRLAGGVAHDFNNLVGVILGYGELAQVELGTDHAAREDVDEMVKAAQRAAELTRQLQAFSRKQVMQPTSLDLNVLVADADRILGRLIGESIRLVVRMAPDLGCVMADPGQIERVILNLALNARDAMPHGGTLSLETANAHLRQEYIAGHPMVVPGPYVMLAISDSGVGMSLETQSRIFDPFFTTKGPSGGTGLGLATVYGIVKQSGGYVWVYSEPGKGTTFRIYLPRVDHVPEPVRPAAPAPALLPSGHETVLVAEDNASLLQVIRARLTERGYTVLVATDGEQALSLAATLETPVDLLLTDVIMPRLGGAELARQLVDRWPGLRVIFMSGYTDGALSTQGVLSENIVLIEKPFSGEKLARTVREVLDRNDPA